MKNIKYALRGITMEQFATIFEPSSDKISLNVSIPIKTNYEGHSLAVGASVQFVENEKPFLVAEAFCHYEIEKSCWDKIYRLTCPDCNRHYSWRNLCQNGEYYIQQILSSHH